MTASKLVQVSSREAEPLEFDPERVRFMDLPPSEKDSTPENEWRARGA